MASTPYIAPPLEKTFRFQGKFRHPLLEQLAAPQISQRRKWDSWSLVGFEAGVSDARMEGILSHIKTTAGPEVEPSVLEVMMHELSEAARSTHPGPASAQ